MSSDRFDLTLLDSQKSSFGFSLCYISLSQYGRDWHSVPHGHTCAELFYVLRGNGQFLLDSGAHPIGPGDLVFVDPLVRHTEQGTGEPALEYMVLGIEHITLTDLPENVEGCRILHSQDYSEEIRSCLQNLRRELEQKAPGFETACGHLAELLAIRLMRNHAFAKMQSEPEQNISKECALVRRYIDKHFKEPINLDLLAQVAHLNKYHLSHVFRRECGISPISYLLSLRIRESQRLLRSTDHSLGQIAQLTGFSSPSCFSQSFRRAVGLSSAQYRNQSKNKENER